MSESEERSPSAGSVMSRAEPLEDLEALRGATAIILEIREEYARDYRRRIELYERTLGLAVIPVLLRRVVLMLLRKSRSSEPSTR